MGLSENRAYSQTNSHLIGIMISKTMGFRGTRHFQTHPYVFSDKAILQQRIWYPMAESPGVGALCAVAVRLGVADFLHTRCRSIAEPEKKSRRSRVVWKPQFGMVPDVVLSQFPTMYFHNLKGFFPVFWNVRDHTQTLYHSSQDLEAVPGCESTFTDSLFFCPVSLMRLSFLFCGSPCYLPGRTTPKWLVFWWDQATNQRLVPCYSVFLMFGHFCQTPQLFFQTSTLFWPRVVANALRICHGRKRFEAATLAGQVWNYANISHKSWGGFLRHPSRVAI